MYGSDKEYQTKPHTYQVCFCSNHDPHCWYCGENSDAAVHVIEKGKDKV